MMTKNQRRFAVTALAAAAALGLTGYSVYNKNKIIWDYLGEVGSTPYKADGTLPYKTASGEPDHPDYKTSLASLPTPDLPASLLSRIAIMLPESLNIAGNTRIQLSADDQTNLVLAGDQPTDVYVSFLSEGAGYRNSVGYFTYDPANPPTKPTDVKTEQIFFPNATQGSASTDPFKVATSTAASTVKFTIPATGKRTGVGFFIIADGWSGSRDLRLAGGTNTSGTSTPGVDESYPGKRVFYSLKALNPEADDYRNLRQHTILLNDNEVTGRDGKTPYQRLVLGFEDQPRTGGDHDFNDVLMAVHVTPAGIENITNLKSINGIPGADKDKDGDGVDDLNDAYPDDPTAASYVDYTSSNGWGTLAYEDRWPALGDYDLNDLVVRYRSRLVKHGAGKVGTGKVARLEMTFRLDARGAGKSNGFALALPGILPGEVESATLTTISASNVVGQPVTISPLAEDRKQAVFEIFKNASALQPSQSGGNCKSGNFYNTAAGCPIGGFTEFKLVVKMKTSTSVPSYAGSFPTMPFDPFLFDTKTVGIEVHLPGKKPSARADTKLFKTGVDASKDWNSTTGTYTYMTAQGLPWALNIPALWDYPVELKPVDQAYSNFVNWAKSGGTQYRDWYLTPSDKTASTYGKSDKASLQAAKTFRNGRTQP